MFQTLLYETHITSSNLKRIEFEDSANDTDLRLGYFLRNNRILYWLDSHYKTANGKESVLKLLPIRPKQMEIRKYKEDLVNVIMKPIPFSITAEKTFPDVRMFIDSLFPFEHSNPIDWKLMKIISVMAFVGKTMLVISTPPAFGKTAIFSGLNCINNKSPVFKPRSVPGTLNQINTNGNMVFDEIQGCNGEVKHIIEDIIKFVGDGKPMYHNGALASHNTKQSYDITLQSMTFLVNHVSDYKNADKNFFDNIFDDKGAVDNRLLKLKFNGELTTKFERDFDILQVADDNKRKYIDIAKYMLYLQQIKRKNTVKNAYNAIERPFMSNRQASTYDEITWLISLYSTSVAEYNELLRAMNTAFLGYKEQIAGLSDEVIQYKDDEKI